MNKVFWVKEPNQDNESRGYIERVEYGKNGVELFDHKLGRINIDVLKPHIGEKIEFYRDGELVEVNKIGEISKNEDGVISLIMDSVEAETVKSDNEI